jgi:hypothetical protein
MNWFKGLLCSLLFFSWVDANAQIPAIMTKKYAPSLLKEDVELLKKVVLKMHPAVGIYENRENITRLFDNLSKSITDSLTEKQFRVRLKLVTNDLRCGHTEIAMSKVYNKASNKLKVNFAPYYFLPIQNKLLVLASFDKKKDTLLKVGTEVKRINGISVDTSFALIRKMISTDGFIPRGKDYYLMRTFNLYHYALFGRPDTMTIDYLNADSNMASIRIKSDKLNTLPPLPLSKKEDSLYTRYKRASMSFRYFEEDKKTMHLRLHSFSSRKYRKAYRRIFRQLKYNSTENLVIDLRHNGGGRLTNAYRLLSYTLNEPTLQTLQTGIKRYPYKKNTSGRFFYPLTRFVLDVFGKHTKRNDTDFYTFKIKPRKKHHFNGKIFVLINGGSFSASCLTAAYLKQQKRAVFIGEETSGTYEGCNAGITPFYTLPNTRVRARIPAFRIMHDPITNITGRGIIPEYPTPYTFKDILLKKDLEILKVQELLKK